MGDNYLTDNVKNEHAQQKLCYVPKNGDGDKSHVESLACQVGIDCMGLLVHPDEPIKCQTEEIEEQIDGNESEVRVGVSTVGKCSIYAFDSSRNPEKCNCKDDQSYNNCSALEYDSKEHIRVRADGQGTNYRDDYEDDEHD